MISRRSGVEGSTTPAHSLLHPSVQRWLWQQGFSGLRPLQAQVVEHLFGSESDLAIRAPVGVGKNTALALPMFSWAAEPVGSGTIALHLCANDESQRRRCEAWRSLADATGVEIGDATNAGIRVSTPRALEADWLKRGARAFEDLAHLAVVAIERCEDFVRCEEGLRLQSLLHRLELGLRRRVVRVASGAAWLDSQRLAEWLRSGGASEVEEVFESSLASARRWEFQVETVSTDVTEGMFACLPMGKVAVDSVLSLRRAIDRFERESAALVFELEICESAERNGASALGSLHPTLIQAIACVQCMAIGWSEPLQLARGSRTVLAQQILSLHAQYGPLHARESYRALCRGGPFSGVDRRAFLGVLGLLTKQEFLRQRHDGSLVLDRRGETVQQELPEHSAASAEEPEAVHDRVREAMLEIYVSAEVPAYLGGRARDRLEEARRTFSESDLAFRPYLVESGGVRLFPWIGDRTLRVLTSMLRQRAAEVCVEGPSLHVAGIDPATLLDLVRDLCSAPGEAVAEPFEEDREDDAEAALRVLRRLARTLESEDDV